jgi:serine/threonine protein kinase
MARMPTFPDLGTRAADTPIPLRLGQYLLLDRLGAGGMGLVFKAQHTKLKKTVALKLLPTERMAQAGMVERFHQEMEAIGRLEHPNVIRATDAGEEGGRHYLVMEYAQGQDLLKVLRERTTLPVDQACTVIRQAALGLQYIADQGLVHRDIKPSNLLLTTTGHVKILDLGLALLKDADASGDRELTSPGQVMGTWDFMAPEQTRDSHKVDIRADIYSLGCTFYKLLTGQAPFATAAFDSYKAKALAHQETPVPPAGSLRGDIPEAIQAILDKMLAKDPADRYRQPLEVAQALEAFPCMEDLSSLVGSTEGSGLDGSTIRLKADGGADTSMKNPSTGFILPGRKPSRPRGRWLAIVAAATLFAAIALAAALLWRDYSPGEGKQETPDEPILTGRWYPLMNRPPKELFWPKNIDPPLWRRNQEEILAEAGGYLGLLGLGEVSAKQAFRFKVLFRQNQWAGQLGVFFGFHKEEIPDGTYIRFQSLDLKQSIAKPGNFRWERMKAEFRLTPDGKMASHGTAAAVAPIDRPHLAEHALEIAVSPTALLQVLWDGVALPDLYTAGVHARFTKEDYGGAFGVFVNSSMAVFREGRVMYLER